MKTVPVNEQLSQASERAIKRHWDEYVRKDIERYKQTDRYKEYVRRKQQAEQDLPESAKGE